MEKHTRHILPNERGSAILLALGILSLALILGMAFAFTARTDRQIAQVSADTVKVRLLSESALERMLAAMQYNFANSGAPYVYPAVTVIPPPGFNISARQIEHNNYLQHYLTLGSDTSAAAETHNAFSNLLLNNFAVLNHVNNALTTKLALGSAGFQTLLVDSRVVGRIGYLLLEEGGKFDLNECLTLKKGSNTPFVVKDAIRLNGNFSSNYGVNDFIYNLGGIIPLGTPTWTEANTVRQGLLLQELRVAPKFLTNLPENADTRLQWFSYQQLYDVIENNTVPSDFYTAEDFLKHTVFSAEEPEAWWHPGNKKEYHRFDISGYEWRSNSDNFYNTSYEIISANTGWSKVAGDTLVTNLISGALTEFADSTSINNIPYLSLMVDRNGASVSRHVAANLIDYCDENNSVTTDFDLGWTATPSNPAPPNYCGLEKVAAISEVGLEVVVERTDLSSGTSFRYLVKLRPSVDFANIFSETVPIGSGKLLIDGTMSITSNSNPATAGPFNFPEAKFVIGDQGSIADSDEYTGEVPFNLDTSVADQTQTPYYLVCNQEFAGNAGLSPTVTFALTINKIAVQMEETATEIYDVAYCNQGFNLGMVFPGDDTGDITLNFYASMEAEDPRCNHRSEFWHWTDLGATRFTMGSKPACLNALLNQDGTVYDEENTVKFSTGYIRNAPPKSFWELGAIHRGEPMRTINLKKFTAPESSTGTYQNGDAAILDQVKMGPLKYCRGKYNPNARNIQAVLDLLPNIENGGNGNYEVTVAVGSPLPMPDAASLTWTSAPSHYRGQFTEVVALDTYPDDRQAEAAIGCTANLLSTRHDPYTLVIVAQTMKELRMPDGAAMNAATFNNIKPSLVCPTEYTVGSTPRYCDILGTQLYLAHIIRNTWTNEFKVAQGQYLDE